MDQGENAVSINEVLVDAPVTVASPALTATAPIVNTASVLINGRSCLPGQAIGFRCAGGASNGQAGQLYYVRLHFTSTIDPAREATVPIFVQDYPAA